MNPSKLYVPNPQKWVKFFKKMANERSSSNQIGGRNIIPVGDGNNDIKSIPPVTLKTVSPAQQVVEQAKSELERDEINTDGVRNLNSVMPIRRRRKKSTTVRKNRSRKIKTRGKKKINKHQHKNKKTHKNKQNNIKKIVNKFLK